MRKILEHCPLKVKNQFTSLNCLRCLECKSGKYLDISVSLNGMGKTLCVISGLSNIFVSISHSFVRKQERSQNLFILSPTLLFPFFFPEDRVCAVTRCWLKIPGALFTARMQHWPPACSLLCCVPSVLASLVSSVPCPVKRQLPTNPKCAPHASNFCLGDIS